MWIEDAFNNRWSWAKWPSGPKPNSPNLCFRNTVRLGASLTAALQSKFSEVHAFRHYYCWATTPYIALWFSLLTGHHNHLNKTISIKAERIFKSEKESQAQATHRKEDLPGYSSIWTKHHRAQRPCSFAQVSGGAQIPLSVRALDIWDAEINKQGPLRETYRNSSTTQKDHHQKKGAKVKEKFDQHLILIFWEPLETILTWRRQATRNSFCPPGSWAETS